MCTTTDNDNEESLRLLLEHCPASSRYYSPSNTIINTNTPSSVTLSQYYSTPIHPTLVSDDEGDLPLHFAVCNGVESRILTVLTSSLGDARSALVRNSQGRLAIDDLIAWYVDLMDESNSEEESEEELDSEEEDEDSEEADIDKGVEFESEEVRPKEQCATVPQLVSNMFRSMLLLLCRDVSWRRDLWDRMHVLIQAAARAISGNSSQLEPYCPVHAAVLATKHANFPALALVASTLVVELSDGAASGQPRWDGSQEDARMTKALSSVDSLGHLPLHLACSKSNSSPHIRDTNQDPSYPLIPTLRLNPELVRWNTPALPCSMIQFLLHYYPSAARTPTPEGRISLHLVLECNDYTDSGINGLQHRYYDHHAAHEQYDDVKMLLKACPEALATPDMTTHMYPFQTAAASSNSSPAMVTSPTTKELLPNKARLLSLENTYRLIMEDPSLCRVLKKY